MRKIMSVYNLQGNVAISRLGSVIKEVQGSNKDSPNALINKFSALKTR